MPGELPFGRCLPDADMIRAHLSGNLGEQRPRDLVRGLAHHADFKQALHEAQSGNCDAVVGRLQQRTFDCAEPLRGHELNQAPR